MTDRSVINEFPEGDVIMERNRNILIKGVLMLALIVTVVFSAGCDDDDHCRMHYNRPYYPDHHRSRNYSYNNHRNHRSYRHAPAPRHRYRKPRAHWDEDDWEDYIDDLEDWKDRRFD